MGHSQEDATAGDALTRDLFLITSAINNDYGIYSQQQKIDQLINGINSVHEFHDRLHDIMLIDCSPKLMSDAQLYDLQKLGVDVYRTTLEKPVKDPSLNQPLWKSIGEQLIWSTFFTLCPRFPDH